MWARLFNYLQQANAPKRQGKSSTSSQSPGKSLKPAAKLLSPGHAQGRWGVQSVAGLPGHAPLLRQLHTETQHRWKCVPLRHFANPRPAARQLKPSKKWLPAEEKWALGLFAELRVHRYRCAWRLSLPSISNPLAAICVSARVAPSGLHF